MALRIRRAAEMAERVTQLVHRPQERQPVPEVAGIVGVATHDERTVTPPVTPPVEQVGEVRAVADHVRRQVRHGPEPGRLEVARGVDRRLDRLWWATR